MLITPLATTQIISKPENEYATLPWLDWPEGDKDADHLAEFAGRACYKSWNRPNPATATNVDYLKNIINQQHFSVMEHASISFYAEGVSRSLLAELTRHRHLSFSVVSQRYVRMDREEFVVPPAIVEYGDEVGRQKMYMEWTIHELFEEALNDAFEKYNQIADALIKKGVPRKKAFEAARSVLPNAVESPMVVSGNIRAWRDVLGKRYHIAADAEIQEFAVEVLHHLREYAPNSVQDIPEVPYGDL